MKSVNWYLNEMLNNLFSFTLFEFHQGDMFGKKKELEINRTN